MLVKRIANDLLEISQILTLSHKSRGGNVAIIRSGKFVLNPSAYSTINAWNPSQKISQTSLLDAIGPQDGGKLCSFIITSLVDQLSRLPFNERLDEMRLIESESLIYGESILGQESKLEHLISLDEDDELCRSVAEAVYASQGGHISLERGDGVSTIVEHSESMSSETKCYHIETEVRLKGPMIYLCAQSISKFSHIEPILELMGTFPQRPLLIIAPMIGVEVLSTLKINRDNSVVEAYAIETPRVTWAKGWMDDFSAFTGSKVHHRSIEKFSVEMFGSALESVLQPDKIITTPYDEHIDATLERAEYLIKEAESIRHNHTKDLWTKRASELTGSLVRLKIGAPTDLEARVKRNKTEKVVLSMSDMYLNGHVQGSIPYLACAHTHSKILNRALRAPWRVVCRNLHKVTEDPSVLDLNSLQEPFPVGRLKSIIRRSVSISITLSSCAISVKGKK